MRAVFQEFMENFPMVTISRIQQCCQITFLCNMHNTAITEQLWGHLQVDITSCCSESCLTIIICIIYTEAMLQQQSK
jgi:hypothetical protein